MATTTTDALDILTNDHHTVEGLFHDYETKSLTPARRKTLVDRMVKELSIHAAIEEQIFYPAVRRALGESGNALVEEGLDEHREVKELLADIQKLTPSDPAFDAKVREMMGDVRHHVREEEDEMFPMFRVAISADRLAEMGAELGKAKKIAPTRPHPLAPDEPPANIVTGVAAGAVDQVRDAIDETTPDVGSSAMKVAFKAVAGLAMVGGVALGVAKAVHRRRVPKTRIEQAREIALDVKAKAIDAGAKAIVVGARAAQIGGQALSTGAEALRTAVNKAS